MEVVLVIAVALALYWALSAKRASQLTVRYQAHKDALAEAARYLLLYHHRPASEDRDDDHFDVSGADLEVREFLNSDLQELAVHVRTTRVPVGLGQIELLRELLEALGRVRAWTEGPLRPEARRELRQRAMDQVFEQLRGRLESFDTSSLVHFQLEVLSSLLDVGRDALKWKTDGTRIAITDARQLIGNGEALLRQNNYRGGEENS